MNLRNIRFYCFVRLSYVRPFFASLTLVLNCLHGTATANVVGSDFQNFNPTTNGIDFVTVQSGQTLSPGVFNLGLFANYAVNAIPEFKNDKPYNWPRGKTRNRGLFSDLNFGLGLTHNWDFGMSLPAILWQSIKSETDRIQYADKGVNEFRVNSKVKLFGDDAAALVFVGTMNMNLITNNPYAGTPSRPIYTLEVAGHTSSGPMKIGTNFGYRKKNPGDRIPELVAEPFHDQWIGSLAASYHIESANTKIIGEFFGSEPANKKKSDTEILQRSGEVLVGAKYDVSSSLALHSGATIGVIESPATPDWRIYAGLNWNGGPLWGETTSSYRGAESPRTRPVVIANQEPNEASPAPAPTPLTPQPAASAQPTNKAPVSRETFVLENILFATDSSTQVLQGAIKELKELVQYLQSIPAWSSLIVEGHTDYVGDAEYNKKLSQNRANSIRAYLIKHMKLEPGKIKAIGYGESRPIADNSNYQGRQLNRRVEIKIFD